MFVAQLGAPVDTAAVVSVVKDFVAGGIPWLDPRVTDWLTQLILAVPIVPTILAWKGVAAKVREASPWVNEHFGKKFQKFAFIINPILAGLIAGGFWGDSTIGFAATALWAMGESAVKQFGPKPPSELGIVKGRALGTILGVGLSLAAIAGVSHAGEQPFAGLTVDRGVAQFAVASAPAPSFMDRVAFSAGGGVKREFAPGPNDLVGFLGVQVGYLWNDHLSPRVRVTRDLREGSFWEAEVSLWGVW